jgi:molybdopterin-guanine dinucleotide biosynthesis protein A
VTRALVVGIFVGGAARRMGGKPKGLLLTRGGERVIDRTVALARKVSARVVLVGRSDAYALDLPCLPDRARGAEADPGDAPGPLGGLCSLLEDAASGDAIAIACDMPFLTADLLARLATFEPGRAAVAPKRGGRWEPLFARFDAARALPVVEGRLARRALAMQGVLDELAAGELPLLPGESTLLSDWDCPEDMQ